MGRKGAVEVLYKGDATEAQEGEYREKFAHPYLAAARGYLDDIIDPRDTRPRLIDALTTLETKRDKNPPKKHGNLPLWRAGARGAAAGARRPCAGERHGGGLAPGGARASRPR